MEKKQTFSVHTERDVKLTVENIDDIMVAALEGGINYWCSEAEVGSSRASTNTGLCRKTALWTAAKSTLPALTRLCSSLCSGR